MLLHGDYYYYDNHVYVVDEHDVTYVYSIDYAYHKGYDIEMEYSTMNDKRHFIECVSKNPFNVKCFMEERITYTIFEKL